MNKKLLLSIFLIVILIKIVFIIFIPTPTAFSDNYTYSKMASSFWNEQTIEVHNLPVTKYPPLYSMLISPAYIFKDMVWVFFLIKVINSILSSLIIIPTYLLAKNFLNKKYTFLISLIVGILPPFFSLSANIMAENLFYTLFTCTLFFLYKSSKNNNTIWPILTGIFMGLTLLTKTLGLVLIPTILVYYYSLLISKNISIRKGIQNIGISTLCMVALYSPWYIRNYYLSKNVVSSLGSSVPAYFSILSNPYIIISIFFWIIIYLAYISLAGGIIFPLWATNLFLKYKTKSLFPLLSLTFVPLSFLIMIASIHSASANIGFLGLNGKILGRYVEASLPLLFISGAVILTNYKKKEFKNIILITFLFSLLGTLVSFYDLLPINGSSLTWLGIPSYILTMYLNNKFLYSLIIFSLLFVCFFTFLKIISKYISKPTTILKGVIILFLFINLLSYGITYYNSSNYWSSNPQSELGLWLNENIDHSAVILIDEGYEGKLTKTETNNLYEKSFTGQFVTIFGLWTNNKIIIGDTKDNNADFIITKDKLNLKMVHKTQNNIYVYENEQR
jgi:hypothetical protein